MPAFLLQGLPKLLT